MSKNGYLLTKPFSEFTDKEWDTFRKYLDTDSFKKDMLEVRKNDEQLAKHKKLQ